MRSSIGRITLRGAKRLAGTTGPSRPTAYAPRSNAFPRALCSPSVISTESTRKPDEIDPKEPEHVAAVEVIPDQPEPAVEVMTEDVSILTVETAVPAALEAEPELASAASEEAPANVTRSHTDPDALFDTLRGLIGRNAVRSALWNYGNALQVPGAPALNEPLVKFILPILGRNSWSRSAKSTLEVAIERGYHIGTGSFNCGLHAICKSGDAEAIGNILESMWAMPTESHPNATSYNYLIAAHIYAGHVDEAFNVLSEMKKHLLYPTFATYHALITGCLRRRDPRRAYQTLLAVEKQRFDISAMTIAQVLVASANNDDYDSVLHLLTKFDDSLPRYAAELHRIAEFRSLYRLNTEQRSTKEERDRLRGDPRPELGAISAVLHCAFRGGRADVASRAWMLLQEHYPDFEIPASFWYCLIGAHAGAGEFSKAMDMVGSMREKGLKPSMKDLDLALIRPLAYDVAAIDEQFYRLCDRSAGKDVSSTASKEEGTDPAKELDNGEGNVAEAAVGGDLSEQTEDQPNNIDNDAGEELPADMENSAGEELQTDIENAADRNIDEEQSATLSRENDPESVEGSVQNISLGEAIMKDDAKSWDGFALQFKPETVGIDELNCIIAACSTSLDLDRAFQTFDEVESRFKLERNIDTYNSVLEGCVQTRRLSGGLRVLKEIEAVGLPMRGPTIHLASRLLLRSGRVDEVELMLQKAQERGEHVQLQTFQMVLKQFVRQDENSAGAVLKLGEQAGFDFRSLTGRFDFEGVKKIHMAAYGEPFPTKFNRPDREKRSSAPHETESGVEGRVERVDDESVVEEKPVDEIGEEKH